MDFDRLVELRPLELLHQADRLGRRVLPLAIDLLARRQVCLAVLAHQTTSTPIDRAVPATIFVAASRSLAFRSGIFFSAICRSWAWVILPTFSRFGSPEPLSMPI